jgi:hypothetical protein
MKLSRSVFLAALVVLAGVSAGSAQANSVVKVKAPDPSCPNSEIINAPNVAVDPTGDYYVTQDGTTNNCLDWQNESGMTLFTVDIVLTPTTPNTTYNCIILAADDMVTNAFNLCGTSSASTPPPPGKTILVLSCFSDDTPCNGLLNGQTGDSQTSIPEPSEASLLLFGIGISFLGLGGRKGWKMIGSSWAARRRLATS